MKPSEERAAREAGAAAAKALKVGDNFPGVLPLAEKAGYPQGSGLQFTFAGAFIDNLHGMIRTDKDGVVTGFFSKC